MDPRLETARATTRPKCANCEWWDGRATEVSAAECGRHKMKTADLSVCTEWREYQVHTGQIVPE